MNKYFIASLFLLLPSMHLHADSSVTGAALFIGSAAAVNYARLHKPKTTVSNAHVLPEPGQAIHGPEYAKALNQVNTDNKRRNQINTKQLQIGKKNLKKSGFTFPHQSQEQFSAPDNCDKNNATNFLRSSRNQSHHLTATWVIHVPTYTNTKEIEIFNAAAKLEQNNPNNVLTNSGHQYSAIEEVHTISAPTFRFTSPSEYFAAAGRYEQSEQIVQPKKFNSQSEEIEHYRQLEQSKLHDTLEPLTNYNDQSHQQQFLDGFVGQTEQQHFTNPKILLDKYHTTLPSIKTGVDNNNAIISHERTFFPITSTPQGTKYTVCVHGTNATLGTSFGDDESNPNTQYLINYTQKKSFEENCIVKLLTAKWNGKYDQTAREQSGRNLAEKVKEIICMQPDQPENSVEFIAHSYGCDVARHAIQHLPPQTVRSLFALASPKTELDISERAPEIHVYGDLDGIATAENFILSKRKDTCLHNPLAHKNFRLKLNAQDVDHRTILEAIKHKNLIEKNASSHPEFRSLYFNITPANNDDDTQEISASSSTYQSHSHDKYADYSSDEESLRNSNDSDENSDGYVDCCPHDDTDKISTTAAYDIDKSRYWIKITPDCSHGRKNRRSYTESIASEANSNGVGNHLITKTVIRVVSGLEYLLGGKQSKNENDEPQKASGNGSGHADYSSDASGTTTPPATP